MVLMMPIMTAPGSLFFALNNAPNLFS